MKSIILFCFLQSTLSCSVQGQCPFFDDYIKKGNDILTKKDIDFQAALNAYNTAMLHCPAKADFARKKILEVFKAIENLKKEADIQAGIAKKEAANAKKLKEEADIQTDKAKKEAEKAKRQKDIADSVTHRALIESQRLAKAIADLGEQKRISDSLLDSLLTKRENELNNYKENERLRKENERLKYPFIGKKYQGGIIISLTDSTNQHGLIAAEKDLGEFSWTDATKACDSLNKVGYNGFNNWRLPTKEELLVLYANRALVGKFEEDYYWSSTDKNNRKAWVYPFMNGYRSINKKKTKNYVRPVRDF